MRATKEVLGVGLVAVTIAVAGCGGSGSSTYSMQPTAECVNNQAAVASTRVIQGSGDFRTQANGEPVGSGGDINITMQDGSPALAVFVRDKDEADQVITTIREYGALDFNYTYLANVVYSAPGTHRKALDDLMGVCLK